MRTLRLSVLFGLLLCALGCVDRRFVVTTNVPGAQIYKDGQPVGASPADGRWEYAGYYNFTAVAPGYEPTVKRIRFKPRWFEYPPLDFFAEVLYPFRIEDVRSVELELYPVRPVNQDQLIGEAETLRSRGLNLPPTQVPDKKDNKTGPPAPVTPFAPMTPSESQKKNEEQPKKF